MPSSLDTPPQVGRSPFSSLPLEIHFRIGKTLKKESLAKLARTSQDVRSYYEQQLYKGKNSSNVVKALWWGAKHSSVPAMRNAHGWCANLNTQAIVPDRRNNASLSMATAFQVAIRDRKTVAMQWLWDHGVLVDNPGQPARNMCKCGVHYHGTIEINSSSLHLALCNGNLEAARLLLRLPHTALMAFNFSQQHDATLILNTAVTATFRYQNISFLNIVLANSAIRETINHFKSKGSCTPLLVALRASNINRYQLHSLAAAVLRSLVLAGASLGLYPPDAAMGGRSPLTTELEIGNLRTTARLLLDFGSDPNGDRPNPVTPHWRSPLHYFIDPEHEFRHSIPPWHPNPNPWPLQMWGGRTVSEVRDFIGYLLRKGASLDITDFRGRSPLDNALSYVEPSFLAPRRRVAGYKLVKLLLRNVGPGGISEESRMKAELAMEGMIGELRAEFATHDWADRRLDQAGMGNYPWGLGGGNY